MFSAGTAAGIGMLGGMMQKAKDAIGERIGDAAEFLEMTEEDVPPRAGACCSV